MKKTYSPIKKLDTINFGHKFQISTYLVRTIEGNETEFYLRHADLCSVVIPKLNREECLMVEQHRFGADMISLEFPSGSVRNKGPLEIAQIELEEECGYRSSHLKELGSFYPSAGYSTEKIHVYLAEDLVRVGQKLEKNEYVEVKKIKIVDIPSLISQQIIFDAHTIIAYYYLMQTNV